MTNNLKYIYIGLFLIISLSLVAQSKRDYNWLTANNSTLSPGIEGLLLNFDGDTLAIDTLNDLPSRFWSNNANISDEEGNLLFYTDGCRVINADFELMENGDSLCYSNVVDLFIDGDTGQGYPGVQDVLVLPNPQEESGYFLIHKIREYDTEGVTLFIEGLRYSYVDLSYNDGLGKVTEKRKFFLKEREIMSSYLTAILHENGEDWWIMQTTEEENLHYTCLISGEGISVQDSQRIGIDYHYNASAGGQAKFSPDGLMYANFNSMDGLNLFSFDRATGQLSDHQQVFVPTNRAFSGMEFSPNSRFIYMSTQDSLWQVDTWDDDLQESLVLIDTWDGVGDPFPTTFHLMQLGPDCRIYMCSTSGTKSYHVINKPNEKGAACDFIERGVQLPIYTPVANFPNFPHFRIDEDEICDPGITSMFGVPIAVSRDLKVYPNPSSDMIYFELEEADVAFPVTIELLQYDGKQVYQGSLQNSNQGVAVSQMASGMYIYYMTDDAGKRYIGKVVVGSD